MESCPGSPVLLPGKARARFGQLHFGQTAAIYLAAQLKETHGPRVFHATDTGLFHTKETSQMKYGFPNLFLFAIIITRDSLYFNRDTLFTQLFSKECAIVSAVEFYFICKLCVLHATEY